MYRLDAQDQIPGRLRQMMCRATSYYHRNLTGCMTLLLLWAYYHIPAARPGGFIERVFPLVARWIGHEQDNDGLEIRIRRWRQVLNNPGCMDSLHHNIYAL
ncbi:hypothetical protein PIB30_055823 [Stylosanthes scabra]|uniref:Aminotransferase-like plant mobile domain-containing protein n=1 Tax=Stylosanthes scabra TaxID=79078 RepID=A0ABU6WJ14_9FABA|nr:hypothetical protein [Stylosanthes scabra]